MQPHGQLRFQWLSNVLVVFAQGPFNNEGRAQAGEDYIKILLDIPSHDFSIIEVWDENALGSSEVMNQIGEFWATLLPPNCLRIGIVVSNFIQQEIVASFLPINGKIFQDQKAAHLWVSANLDKSHS